MNHSFFNPVAVDLIKEDDAFVSRLEAVLTRGQRVLFLLYSTGAFEAHPRASQLRELLALPQVSTVADIPANPTVEYLARLRRTVSAVPGTIVALGGGSVIDIAKALVAFAAESPGLSAPQLLQRIARKEYTPPPRGTVSFTAIPTTAGTGAELTRWATIWDAANQAKYSIEHEDLYASAAWIVPSLTACMPPALTVATGLDALGHALEAYWSTRSNPVVRRLAAEAIRHVVKHLPRSVLVPADLSAREGMCLGALFAGLAFSQTRTAAAHALSYPLTARFDIPHGIAVAMGLAGVMRVNWTAIEEKEQLLAALGCDSIEQFAVWLDSVTSGIVSLRLSEHGVTRANAADLWERAGSMQERLGNNPVPLTTEDIWRVFSL